MADREHDEAGRPVKRLKLSGDEGAAPDAAMADAPAPAPVAEVAASSNDNEQTEKSALKEQIDKEERFGITAFVNTGIPGFSGILKQRYVDFMVHEILPNGQVCRLEDDIGMTAAGAQKDGADNGEQEKLSGEQAEEAAKISDENRDILHGIFGEDKTKSIMGLNKVVLLNPNRKASQFKPVYSNPVTDKMARQRAHESIREIFSGRLVTTTQDDNVIKVSARGKANQGGGGDRDSRPHRQTFEEMGGDNLHFTLYKENKDTMEVISHLASQLKTVPKKFSFAGTKDRRAVTVQRVSVKRIRQEHIANVARGLFNARIGSLSYQRREISLGDHSGNQFTITLRDCHFQGEDGMDCAQRLELARDIVEKSTAAFQKEGFINYFGLQRFGTYEVSTDSIGKYMLSEDLGKAVDLILAYSDEALAAAQDPESKARISEDDKKRALGLHKWKTEKNGKAAYDLIPFRFSGERGIVKHLGTVRKNGESYANDFQGALGTLPKTLRGMYVHAYQSIVWNVAASERWSRHGAKVIPGDLVLVAEHKDKETKKDEEVLDEVDEFGEVVINPQGDNAATAADDFERARALTEEEANSGLYSIFDVVLPQPGWDVEYPKNDIGKFYSEYMLDPKRGGGVDPYNMRRKWRDISLPGGYRKLMARSLGPVSFDVKTYRSDEEELVETDLSKLVKEGKSVTLEETKKRVMRAYNERPATTPANAEGEEKIAAVLTFQLGSSTYATMALRELMKGGTEAYKPDFTR
ncbi:Multisubstrate pseudouridine synthase 7 [Lasiodiplodia hormozganensis]|uniref:Multisubstrate pseudouridine synthase 7 n=1 Tax=Lasiodiplodia hormozganensis TaxID=869390 RepID=A0AA39WNI7_9PEZI|nr:Multisubstrate pseudouridine synthase 7 [Lasiodiplodia hormozganensis]